MKIICAYPVNLDAVYDLEEDNISRFIQSADPRGIKSELKGSIRSREDLISSLLYCIEHGSGAEILVESRQLAEEIEVSFPWSFRLGGNAGIMANLLAGLGARPILNSPALEPRMAALLHPGAGIPVWGRLLEPSLAAERPGPSSEVLHFVFQFKESDRIPSPQGPIAAAKDNRFIATYDPVNTRMASTEHFDAYCQDHIQDIDGAILSGFHLAPLDRYREIFPPRIEQIRSWKEANPNIYIHVEMGSFQSQKIARHFLSLLGRIPPDSLGLNEDELETAAAEYSAIGSSPVSSTALSTSRPEISQWQERVQKAARLREDLGIFRVAVHTRDYILSIMEEGRITAREELLSLQKGADAAAALAATGSVAGEPPEEVNSVGLNAREEFCRSGAKAAGRGAFLHSGGGIVSLMPSLLAREPRITVGLGDTATAATFYQELQAIKKSRN